MDTLTQTIAPSDLIDITNDSCVADEIGALRGKIKALRDQQTFLEGLLKHKGVTVAEGEQYRVTISYAIETRRVDWKAIAAKLEPSRQLTTAYTSFTVSDRVAVKAHTKS